MERFKFRVWDKERKCFFNDDEVVIYPNGEESFFNADYDFTECVVEQCTGLKDKNGKLIYEGDIVREVSIDEDSAMGAEHKEVSVVCFGGGDYPCSFTLKHPRFYRGYALLNYGYMRQEIEVIGNIHENADLLGE